MAHQSPKSISSVKYLGVILSKDLTWNDHINSVCLDDERWVGFFYRQFHLADTPCLYQLCKSLVLPTLQLDCCSSVWDPSSALYTEKFESVQDFATKVITKQWNTSSNDRLRLLNLPRLSTRRTRQKLSLCYRIVTGRSITPPRFFTPHPCPHLCHNHHLSLYYPSFRTSAHKSSFSVSVVPLWNSLHRDLVSSPSC